MRTPTLRAQEEEEDPAKPTVREPPVQGRKTRQAWDPERQVKGEQEEAVASCAECC